MLENVRSFLNYSIVHYNNYVLTPLNIVIVLLILSGTRILLSFAKRIIFKRISHDEIGRSNSLFQIVKYFVWVIAISLCLESVGINLSILIAGSAALMVGIGFGLQNIFNDFTSGIIILIDRSIKVGDILETGGIVGEVREIRLRTTKVLTREDTILIIPNHKFISETVLNWTENDWNTRFTVTVGVAYGSDVQLVKSLLLKAAEEHPRISSDPKPIVRFISFGESSLDFELFFWSESIFRVGEIQSDLRFKIDELFRAGGVTIPFPQRDVHIKQ